MPVAAWFVIGGLAVMAIFVIMLANPAEKTVKKRQPLLEETGMLKVPGESTSETTDKQPEVEVMPDPPGYPHYPDNLWDYVFDCSVKLTMTENETVMDWLVSPTFEESDDVIKAREDFKKFFEGKTWENLNVRPADLGRLFHGIETNVPGFILEIYPNLEDYVASNHHVNPDLSYYFNLDHDNWACGTVKGPAGLDDRQLEELRLEAEAEAREAWEAYREREKRSYEWNQRWNK